MLATIIARGFEALRPSFIFQNSVYISPSTPLDYGGVGHAIVGTFLIVGIATIISVPLGIASAVYVTEIRGRAVPYVRFFVQAMSGVPSVVAGLFVLTVFILTGVMRQSALAGAIAYAILMLPTVAPNSGRSLAPCSRRFENRCVGFGLHAISSCLQRGPSRGSHGCDYSNAFGCSSCRG